MGEEKILAARFEADRRHLHAVAYRMLGSKSEAEDAVQEAWLRLAGSDASAVANLRGWLTTTVGRICLDMLRARKTRREEPLGIAVEGVAADDDIERETETVDAVGLAMLSVLEKLTPPERVAFVLHDMFNVAFDEVAPIVGRSAAAARQLASRARRRVDGEPPTAEIERAGQRKVVAAFLAASRSGDFSALLAVLDPDVVLRADAAAVAASLSRPGAPALAPEIRGAEAVAKTFAGRARAARPALVEGDVGLVFAPGSKPMAVFDFVVEDGRVIEIGVIVDPQSIAALDLRM